MTANARLFPSAADREIGALIKTLQETEHRLEELTAGEVDTVVDLSGRTFVLRHAQEEVRLSEAVTLASILNALPAQTALLDTQGRIVAVNAAWQIDSDENAAHAGYRIGEKFLLLDDQLAESDPYGSLPISAGALSVLSGDSATFSTEYVVSSATEQRWFLITVSPLARDHPNGAVVMRLDITERRRLEAHILEASTNEQRRFALDLHDGLGQDLVGLSLLATAAAKRSRQAGHTASTDLERIASIAAKACHDTRMMAHGLAPLAMASGDLTSALQRLASTTADLHGVQVVVTLRATSALHVRSQTAEHLYRIAQEAVWNSVKHARSLRTRICLSARGDRLCLTVRDDGRGVPRQGDVAGIGVELMRYRARVIGGHLSIALQRNGSTKVRCVCPI